MGTLQLSPVRDPREVGMDRDRLSLIDRLLEKEIEVGNIPGAVVLIARKGKIVKYQAYGQAMEEPTRREMTPETIFDLASLTKVVVTVPLALLLIEHGAWRLEDPITRFLPSLKWGRGVSIHHLLTHTAGLPPWAALFSLAKDEEEVLELLASERWPVATPICAPGERVIYSDLGYIILGLAIAKITEKDLAALGREWIFSPLKMQDTMFNPPESLASRIAPTEDDPKRGGVLVGTVHDENAWVLGGVSGHAGLFSTANDLAIYAQMLLNKGRYGAARVLSSRSVKLMRTLQTEGLNERRGVGWLLQGQGTVSAGDLLSEHAIGHTGFTGTSLWIDPRDDLIVVLLTNRVHPSRERGKGEIPRIRALVNDVSVGAIIDE